MFPAAKTHQEVLSDKWCLLARITVFWGVNFFYFSRKKRIYLFIYLFVSPPSTDGWKVFGCFLPPAGMISHWLFRGHSVPTRLSSEGGEFFTPVDEKVFCWLRPLCFSPTLWSEQWFHLLYSHILWIWDLSKSYRVGIATLCMLPKVSLFDWDPLLARTLENVLYRWSMHPRVTWKWGRTTTGATLWKCQLDSFLLSV